MYNLNKYWNKILNVEAEAEVEAEVKVVPPKMVEAEAKAETMLFEKVEAEAVVMNRPVLTFDFIIIIKFSLPLAFCIARLRSNFLISLE